MIICLYLNSVYLHVHLYLQYTFNQSVVCIAIAAETILDTDTLS